MRQRLAISILVPVLMLGGCDWLGLGNTTNNMSEEEAVAAAYELPGGRGVDRERFRGFATDFCRSSLSGAPAVSPGELEPLCACVTERFLKENDGTLRAILRDSDLLMRKQDEAVTACRGAPLSDLSAPSDVRPAGAARPRANLASYLSSDDYPAAAIRNEEQGSVAFALDIGADGRVTDCRVRQSSGSAALDAATCRIMRSRARYTPARDADGKAIAGHDQGVVRWVLPPE